MSQLLELMSNRFNLSVEEFESVIKKTVMPTATNDEQFLSFLSVANEYNLNPLTKEIYAFPAKGGGIQPIVSVDGWLNIVNSHKEFDGVDFKENSNDQGDLISVTCRIYRKDRSHPIEVTEYLDECKRNTEPWLKWPSRMLRHKAFIQCARYAFNLSGIIDEDEAVRYKEAKVINATPEVTNTITLEQSKHLEDRAKAIGVEQDILTACFISSFKDMPADKYQIMLKGIEKKEKKLSQNLDQIAEAE